MRSSRATSSAVACVALAALAALAVGCKTVPEQIVEERRAKAAHDLVGTWVGKAADPPAQAWFANAELELTFTDEGRLFATAKTKPDARVAFAFTTPYALFFEGKYEVSVLCLKIEERNLGGLWTYSFDGSAHLRLSRQKPFGAPTDFILAREGAASKEGS